MKWRARWSHVVIALAVIAALAIASPVFGLSKSIKKAIKKEVSKQLANATGPAGANGTNGTDGTDGTNGTARAYARVDRGCSGGAPEVCGIDRAKGVTGAARISTGRYCVNAPGIDPLSEVAAVAVDRDGTATPFGNASVIVNTDLDCSGGGGGFGVETYRQPVTTVRNAAGDGTTDVAGNAALANDVAFAIVIP
jgi:hypothetical protein